MRRSGSGRETLRRTPWPGSAPRTVSAFSVCLPPSTATIRRIINRVCPGGLADLLGCDPSGADTLAVDGKSARGSRHGDTPAAHLLAAMTGGGLTVTQLRVPDKTNEITCFAGLLAPFDLTGVTVTADALHAQRGHARFLAEGKKAHYALCVKKNQAGDGELHDDDWAAPRGMNRLSGVRGRDVHHPEGLCAARSSASLREVENRLGVGSSATDRANRDPRLPRPRRQMPRRADVAGTLPEPRGRIAGVTFLDEGIIARLAEDHGVPADVVRELTGLLRPCVFLVPHEDLPESTRLDARPAGRMGGLPSLPESIEWPAGAEPFVLSVDCAALPRDFIDIELPLDGQLLFFTTFKYEPEQSAVVHVSAGVETVEHPLPEDVDDQEAVAYEPRTLYPLPGLTLDHDWCRAPATTAFKDGGADHDEVAERFVEAVVHSVQDGSPSNPAVQIGGCSNQWQVPPDRNGYVLLAQIAGNGLDHNLFTLNLIVGTREDITAGRWESLRYEQQC